MAQEYVSDGFRHNAYLDENSTNGFNEGTLRGKLHWQLTDALQADLTLMHVNVDNGYDAWSLYNTYTTYTNQPGRDAQLSNGAALRLTASLGIGELRSVTSAASSKNHLFLRRRLGATTLCGVSTLPTITFKSTIEPAVRWPRICD